MAGQLILSTSSFRYPKPVTRDPCPFMHVYFYCSEEPLNLQEDVVALAEGLEELGVPFHRNCNYWLKSTQPGDYLIKHDPEVTPSDCDAVVVSYAYTFFMRPKTFDVLRRPPPKDIFKKGRKYVTFYVDNHDGHKTVSWDPEYRQFDHILRSKLNRRAWHPANMRPWALGFTNRIVKATAGGLPFGERRKAVLLNFGASHPYAHGTRTLAAKTFLPQ